VTSLVRRGLDPKVEARAERATWRRQQREAARRLAERRFLDELIGEACVGCSAAEAQAIRAKVTARYRSGLVAGAEGTCIWCRLADQRAKMLCAACAKYRRDNGHPRSTALIDRHSERQAGKRPIAGR
jgi:hypothetical protein